MKVLFIKGTPVSEEASRSTQIAKHFIESFKKENPAAEITEIDVYKEAIQIIDADVLSGWGKLQSGEELTQIEAEKVNSINKFTEQFLEHDKYIIQSSMHNLSIPTMLKAYLDTIVTAGKTFKYTPEGPQGLMGGKTAIHIHGSGGFYSETTGIEHANSYISGILNFIGLNTLPTIFVEGIDFDPSKKEEIMNTAKSKAEEVAKKFWFSNFLIWLCNNNFPWNIYHYHVI